MPTRPFRSHTARGLSPGISKSSIADRICLLLTVLFVLASSADAPLQQPFVYTSGGALVAPKITSRRSPPTPPLPGAFTLALGFPCFILVLRFYLESSGFAVDPYSSRWKFIYAMVALAIFVPFLFVANGCGGATTMPAAQKSSIVTPSGTSTLVITPTATNASSKALQLPLIQLTLTVN